MFSAPLAILSILGMEKIRKRKQKLLSHHRHVVGRGRHFKIILNGETDWLYRQTEKKLAGGNNEFQEDKIRKSKKMHLHPPRGLVGGRHF
jgi:hypothetical protein